MKYSLEQLKNLDKLKVSSFSFELFPPKTEEASNNLKITIDELAKLKPDSMTVTYGAGGSTKGETLKLASYIQNNKNIATAAHLTAINSTKQEIDSILESYLASNIKRIVALRGDMPGMVGKYTPNLESYPYAKDLVVAIRNKASFDISVAGYPETHPEANSEQEDLYYLKDKVEAGANRIITQYCFSTDKIISYIDKVNNIGIKVPVIPGIMLIANFKQVVRFSQRCGASIPSWLQNYADDNIDDDQERKFTVALHIAAEQCRILLENGIDKFHFYTLNRYDITDAVCQLLGIRKL